MRPGEATGPENIWQQISQEKK